MKTENVITHSPAETRKLARRIAASLEGPAVLALHGDLGSGKTCFVQGLAEALEVRDVVTSPTFIIVNEHKGRRTLYHVDLYRVPTPEDALRIGMEDYLHPDGITAIEWAERAADLIPADAWHIHFEAGADLNERRIRIRRPGAGGHSNHRGAG